LARQGSFEGADRINGDAVAKMVCHAAHDRTESRGSHYRSDYPEEDNPNWVKNIVLSKGNSDIVLEKTSLSTAKIPPRT
jgi:succinate dehydrogenase/fumarate reductase flavoprotein subunit